MGELSFDPLQRQLSRQIITRSHPAYDSARRVWNAMIDRRPLLIVQPVSTSEVAAAVEFARARDLPLSVKGCGHGVAGRAICDDGMVVDLSGLTRVDVDPVSQTATVQGGANLRSLDSGAQAYGLATTAGIYRGTGVVGLALGGGVGLLMRRFGLTCDNLLAAEVVTADGRVLNATENQNEDLFWGLRGGGGNFGIVTHMQFKLHPLAWVTGGQLTYPFEAALELGQFYRDLLMESSDDLQAYLSLSNDAGELTTSVLLCHSGSEEAGAEVIDKFRKFRRPIDEQVGRISYLQMQKHWDDSFPDGKQRFWKSNFLHSISDDVLRVSIEAIERLRLPNAHIDLEPMGGAISRVAANATAFADRDAASTLLIATSWIDPHETEARSGWARETWKALQPYSSPSGYINYMDQGDEDRTELSYGANYRRLIQVKRTYDPQNFFRFNANIVP